MCIVHPFYAVAHDSALYDFNGNYETIVWWINLFSWFVMGFELVRRHYPIVDLFLIDCESRWVIFEWKEKALFLWVVTENPFRLCIESMAEHWTRKKYRNKNFRGRWFFFVIMSLPCDRVDEVRRTNSNNEWCRNSSFLLQFTCSDIVFAHIYLCELSISVEMVWHWRDAWTIEHVFACGATCSRCLSISFKWTSVKWFFACAILASAINCRRGQFVSGTRRNLVCECCLIWFTW